MGSFHSTIVRLCREDEEDRKEGRQERVSNASIAAVAEVLTAVKGLVSWLNRYIFNYIYNLIL